MKRLAAALAFACILSAGAATYVTNTVEGLLHLLATYDTTDTVIELEAGDYQMPAVPAYTNATPDRKKWWMVYGC